LSKPHSNFKFQEEILLNSKPRKFSGFPFEIHLESEEVPMKKLFLSSNQALIWYCTGREKVLSTSLRSSPSSTYEGLKLSRWDVAMARRMRA
jgi:hypothetical protein